MDYLGIPLYVGNMKKRHWQHILDKFQSKVNHWTFHWLSFASRLTLLKSILQALPLYKFMALSAPKGFLKEYDSLSRKFLWARNLENQKWSLVSWDQVCKPKECGGLGLRQSGHNSLVLASKLYWRWCTLSDQRWARILNFKYLGGVADVDIPRMELMGKGSLIWNTIKRGASLMKEGLFWIINRGNLAHFWLDSWDGHPPILSSHPQLQALGESFVEAGWSNVDSFKVSSSVGTFVVYQWRHSSSWPDGGSLEERNTLVLILVERPFSSLEVEDGLAWGNGPKGRYTVAQGYDVLLGQHYDLEESPWWRRIWNKFGWPKCNLFMWLLSLNKCLTSKNIKKRGFCGPSICFLCGNREESSSHLFFLCSFSTEIWRWQWHLWKR